MSARKKLMPLLRGLGLLGLLGGLVGAAATVVYFAVLLYRVLKVI